MKPVVIFITVTFLIWMVVDLSGITALHLPGWVERHLHEPGADIDQMADWPAKIEAIARLPLEFALDDSMAMAPGMKLSGQPRVIVGARVSEPSSALDVDSGAWARYCIFTASGQEHARSDLCHEDACATWSLLGAAGSGWRSRLRA
mgnify:CR=1 FL=1